MEHPDCPMCQNSIKHLHPSMGKNAMLFLSHEHRTTHQNALGRGLSTEEMRVIEAFALMICGMCGEALTTEDKIVELEFVSDPQHRQIAVHHYCLLSEMERGQQ